jgi:hypothetical protein
MEIKFTLWREEGKRAKALDKYERQDNAVRTCYSVSSRGMIALPRRYSRLRRGESPDRPEGIERTYLITLTDVCARAIAPSASLGPRGGKPQQWRFEGKSQPLRWFAAT